MTTDAFLKDSPYTGSSVKSKRQLDKSKAKAIKETYFLVTWMEGSCGETLNDVINAKAVVPPEGTDILDVGVGMICRVSYTDGRYYKAKVVDVGSSVNLRKKQKQLEKGIEPTIVSQDQETANTPVDEEATPSRAKSNTKPARILSSIDDSSYEDENVARKQTSKSASKRKSTKAISVLSSSSDDSDQDERSHSMIEKKSPKKKATAKKQKNASPRKSPIKRKAVSSRKSPAKKKPAGSAAARILQASRDLSKSKTCNDASADSEQDSLSDQESGAIRASERVTVDKGVGSKAKAAVEKSARNEWQRERTPYDSQTLELRFVQDKVRELEDTTKKLISKVKRQEREIFELKRRTETPSSAIESTSDVSPLVYSCKSRRKSTGSNLSEQLEMDVDDDVEHLMINSHKVDRLRLQSAKLQPDAPKCALQLLTCLFSTEELVMEILQVVPPQKMRFAGELLKNWTP